MLERILSRGGSLFNCWWELKSVQLLWKTVWKFLRKLGLNLPQDPVIQFLGIYSKDAHLCHKNICSSVFIASLFVITRTWKQLRCPSTKQWIKKNVVHLHNGLVLSGKTNKQTNKKKHGCLEICRQIDGIRKKS